MYLNKFGGITNLSKSCSSKIGLMGSEESSSSVSRLSETF